MLFQNFWLVPHVHILQFVFFFFFFACFLISGVIQVLLLFLWSTYTFLLWIFVKHFAELIRLMVYSCCDDWFCWFSFSVLTFPHLGKCGEGRCVGVFVCACVCVLGVCESVDVCAWVCMCVRCLGVGRVGMWVCLCWVCGRCVCECGWLGGWVCVRI